MQIKLKEEIKSKSFWLKSAGILVLLGIVYTLGHSIGHSEGLTKATVKINDEKYEFDKLYTAVGNKQKYLKSLNEDISALTQQKDDMSSELAAAKETISDRDSAKEELSSLKSDITDKRDRVSELNDELASLQGKIQETKEKPITLPAGQFKVGSDIPAGRYKVVAAGRGGNLFVYDSYGDNVVNTIIYSNSNDGETEYVTYLDTDYIIDARYSFKFIPVE